MKEFNVLEQHYKIHVPAIIVGDHLGSNSFSGFVKSFSGYHFCHVVLNRIQNYHVVKGLPLVFRP